MSRKKAEQEDDMHDDDEGKGLIFSRREAIEKAAAAGVLALFGSGTARALTGQVGQDAPTPLEKTFLVVSPELTEGPFFEDEGLNRSDLLEGTTRSSVVDGLPFTLRLRLWELNGTRGRPFKGAKVDLWHCDAIGVYSDELNGGGFENTLGQKWLRGYQVSDKTGEVVFRTIWPGWYPGRTIHYHFKVRIQVGGSTYDFTSQLFIDDVLNDSVMANPPYSGRGNRSTRNSNDGIYRQRQADNSRAGDRLLLTIKDDGKGGRVGTFDVAFDMDGL